MTVTDRLARSCMLALIGFIFHTPKLRMNSLSHYGQPIPLPSGRLGGGFPIGGLGFPMAVLSLPQHRVVASLYVKSH